MAEYICFDKNVEVNGQTVLSTVNAFPEYMRIIGISILEKNNLKNVDKDEWYPQQSWLSSFKEIKDKYGAATLFEIGKIIPANAIFPKEIDSLQKGLASINIAYHMNHRNGEIGYYKLISIDDSKKTAIMECKNPYPCDFDRGIIIAISRKFAPKGSLKISVELDSSKKNRKDGSDKSTYIIHW